MEQKDKEFLLKDLCARLPYGVKLQLYNGELDNDVLNSIDTEEYIMVNGKDDIENIKPYLFPLSSMTEEQKIECFKGTDIELDEHNEIWSTFPISNSDIVLTSLDNWLKVINWLNKNNFDYRRLIEKGLAIDCTNLNIY